MRIILKEPGVMQCSKAKIKKFQRESGKLCYLKVPGPNPAISDQGGKKDKISDNFQQNEDKIRTIDCKTIDPLFNLLF